MQNVIIVCFLIYLITYNIITHSHIHTTIHTIHTMTTQDEKKIVFALIYMSIIAISLVIYETHTLNTFYRWYILSLVWTFLALVVGCHISDGCSRTTILEVSILFIAIAFFGFSTGKIMGWEQVQLPHRKRKEEKTQTIYLQFIIIIKYYEIIINLQKCQNIFYDSQ